MFKKFVLTSALVLPLTFVAAPVHALHAQSVITGGNPQPSGDDDTAASSRNVMVLMIMNVLSSL